MDRFKVPSDKYFFILCPEVEDSAREQIDNLLFHPAIDKIAIMPDCHTGMGVPIGSVLGCEKAVIPNAVGVDIGCGMASCLTSLDASELEDKAVRREILDAIKELVPVGEGRKNQNMDLLSKEAGEFLDSDCVAYLRLSGSDREREIDRLNLASLGGGNHFIELQKNQDGFVNIMLHSGSRNLGHRICKHYHDIAVKMNSAYFSPIPNNDLAFLPCESIEGDNYINDMSIALKYAWFNRSEMMDRVKTVLTEKFSNIGFKEVINCHHNYTSLLNVHGKKYWVHRKGATSAKKGEKVIIPGSMGTASYILEGLGSERSLLSCSHGAGRVMSRTKASHDLTVEECNKAMEGIVFDRWSKHKRKQGLYDLGEAPQAYKDIDEVIALQKDLVKPVDRMTPLMVVKG